MYVLISFPCSCCLTQEQLDLLTADMQPVDRLLRLIYSSGRSVETASGLKGWSECRCVRWSAASICPLLEHSCYICFTSRNTS